MDWNYSTNGQRPDVLTEWELGLGRWRLSTADRIAARFDTPRCGSVWAQAVAARNGEVESKLPLYFRDRISDWAFGATSADGCIAVVGRLYAQAPAVLREPLFLDPKLATWPFDARWTADGDRAAMWRELRREARASRWRLDLVNVKPTNLRRSRRGSRS
jgi:hypothetical protein